MTINDVINSDNIKYSVEWYACRGTKKRLLGLNRTFNPAVHNSRIALLI